MEVSVIKAIGVTVDNPNLPVFYGVDLSGGFPPVKALLGVSGDDPEINYVRLDPPPSGRASGIAHTELLGINGALSRMSLSIIGTFMDGYNNVFAGPHHSGDLEGGDVIFKGLHPLRRYTVRVLASRPNDESILGRIGVYTVSGVSIVIDAKNNVAWHEFVSLYPDQDGNIVMNVVPKTEDHYAYLTGLEVVQA
jgi:hypothetical protein